MYWYRLWVFHVMGLWFDVSKLRVARVSALLVRMVTAYPEGIVVFV